MAREFPNIPFKVARVLVWSLEFLHFRDSAENPRDYISSFFLAAFSFSLSTPVFQHWHDLILIRRLALVKKLVIMEKISSFESLIHFGKYINLA